MDNFSALLGKKLAGSGGGSGTSNYNELENKPQINGNTLSGNKAAANLGLQSAINSDNKLSADLIDDSESTNKFVSATDISNWNNKYDSDDAYTKAQTDTAIETAIAALDVTETGGSGKYISAIKETNGKISATAETMDTVPTSGSTKAVTSGGVQAPLVPVINKGSKNRLLLTLTSGSGDGLTWTVNADGSVTVSGQNTSSRIKQLHLIGSSYKPNSFVGQIISGITDYTGSTNTYRMTVYYSNNGSVYANEQTFYNHLGATIKNYSYFRVSIEIKNGYAFSEPYTFYPMICTASEYAISPEYVPYALPNPTLTPAAIKAVDEGAKNFLTENTKTETGQWTNIPVVLQAGSYVLAIGTLSSTDTDATTCQLGLFNSENQNLLDSYPKLNRGNNIVYSFKITSESSYLRVYSSDTAAHGMGDTVTVTNAMICTAADWTVSQKFVPYCPTNRELYEMIQALQSGTRSLSLSAPSENISKGVIGTTAEVEPETLKSEVEKTEQEAEPEIEEKEGAEER